MIASSGTFFGQPCIIICDGNCAKAWGMNSRPLVHHQGDVLDEDNYSYLADGELGDAPIDPGTYEGDHPKPYLETDRHNKWCARECERSVVIKPGEEFTLPDFSKRVDNKNGE